MLTTRLEQGNVKSFLNEARAIRLRHPHIVHMLDFGLEDDFPFLVIEYAPHGSLRQSYPKGAQLKLGTIRRYVKQIADALQYAHHEGVIHRDIKPDNMLLGKQRELLLSDFGIASIAHTTRSMSEEGQVGTINYMAPEQLQGRPRPASDQYALGIVVYEWICGTRPFHGTVAERPFHRKIDIPLSAVSREKACEDHPKSNLREQTTKKSIEESPTRPKTRFQLHEITLPFASPKKVAAVLKHGRVSLAEACSHIDAMKKLSRAIDFQAWISALQQRVREGSFAFLLMMVSLLLAGILLAGLSIGIFYKSFHTTTVTITPKSLDLGNTFEISAVASAPDPNKQEIALRLLTATSVKASKTVPATGTSLPGTRATGVLVFYNTTASNISFNSVILNRVAGVPVTFNGPVTILSNPGFLTVTGYAVNIGAAGNIGALDIVGSCCAAGITVKNGAFSGGVNNGCKMALSHFA